MPAVRAWTAARERRFPASTVRLPKSIRYFPEFIETVLAGRCETASTLLRDFAIIDRIDHPEGGLIPLQIPSEQREWEFSLISY
ncbi:MAG: hypothetical protein HKL84_08045 [Acidimicrobiaceae bacterium]|nr:hypothetical protein [Acidimicrobiaceae bacterium]